MRITSAPTPTIAIGPLTFSFADSKSLTSEKSDLDTSAASRPNSFAARPAPSAAFRATRFVISAFASSCTPMRPSPAGETFGVTSTFTGAPSRRRLSRNGVAPEARTV